MSEGAMYFAAEVLQAAEKIQQWEEKRKQAATEVDDRQEKTLQAQSKVEHAKTNTQKTSARNHLYCCRRALSVSLKVWSELDKDLEEWYRFMEDDDDSSPYENPSWAISEPKCVQRQIMRIPVAKYHHLRSFFSKAKVQCMITKKWGDVKKIVAVNIRTNSFAADPSEHLSMNPPEYETDIRNFLLLSEGIKQAFEHGRLTFVSVEDTCFRMKILDTTVMNEPIYKGSNLNIGHYDGYKMIFKEEKMPFPCALSFHAEMSLRHAKKMKWIHEDEQNSDDENSARGSVSTSSMSLYSE
eukprot:scaffold25095_cov51-Attheya_sp.AAC.7